MLSKNNGAFATIFSSNGTFVKRTSLVTKTGSCEAIALSALPSAAANYLAQTVPNYIFQKAFSISAGGASKGYAVVIDANNTKYAVNFDGAGNFLNMRAII